VFRVGDRVRLQVEGIPVGKEEPSQEGSRCASVGGHVGSHVIQPFGSVAEYTAEFQYAKGEEHRRADQGHQRDQADQLPGEIHQQRRGVLGVEVHGAEGREGAADDGAAEMHGRDVAVILQSAAEDLPGDEVEDDASQATQADGYLRRVVVGRGRHGDHAGEHALDASHHRPVIEAVAIERKVQGDDQQRAGGRGQQIVDVSVRRVPRGHAQLVHAQALKHQSRG